MTHKDPEVRRAYQRDWRENNRDKTRAYSKAWKQAHPEKHASNVMKHRYGITHAERDAIMVAHNNACAICKASDKPLRVDHCHNTGTVRGVLCHNCNVALGHFKDNPEVIRKAIAYLNKEIK